MSERDNDSPESREPVEYPITSELDLHTFRPQDVKEVVMAYLEACQERGLREVRIIHGKGIGQLRRSVHAILEGHPGVLSYSLATELYGGWGATMVQLRPGPTEPH